MYQEFFGLDRPPFKITPDTSLFYVGNQRGAALEALLYAIKSGEGIVKVIGEVGSGKTMLCRMLELRLNNKSIDVVYIINPSLSPDNILRAIAHELQLEVSSDMSKVEVMQKIQACLLQKHAHNQQVVLFVEEAQSMPVETLEEIRLLSNLETDQSKLLQMVLFGQPELDEKLGQVHIRQLKERITHSFYLAPFLPDDTLQYLNFRLRAVGYRGPDLFSRRTATAIKKYSTGLTRRINILADKALLAAYSQGSHNITLAHIRSAARDSEFGSRTLAYPQREKIIWLVVGVVLVIAILFLGMWLGRSQQLQMSGRPAAITMAKSGGTRVQKKRAVAQQTTAVSGVPVRQAEPARFPLITQRMAAGRQWLKHADNNGFSIQLFMSRTTAADRIEDFLHKASLIVDFSNIYIYETMINGRSWYSVLYGDYDTQKMALNALRQLPALLQRSSPYLRRLSAIQKDVKKWGG